MARTRYIVYWRLTCETCWPNQLHQDILMNIEGRDQTDCMRRLICAVAVSICNTHLFFFPMRSNPLKNRTEQHLKRAKCRWYSIFLLLFFREKKTWHFMWIVCSTDDLHEMTSLIFSEKYEKQQKQHARARARTHARTHTHTHTHTHTRFVTSSSEVHSHISCFTF